jgi:hypothetical protein
MTRRAALVAVAPVVAAVLVAAPPAHAGFRESVAWRAVRTVANAPVTVTAYVLAVAAGARCAWDGREWVLVCTGPRAAIYGGGGTMYGGTFVTPAQRPDACLLRHEARHADQYLLGIGDPTAFAFAYAVAEATKAATGGFNVFERDAGLADGGYVPGTTCRAARRTAR